MRACNAQITPATCSVQLAPAPQRLRLRSLLPLYTTPAHPPPSASFEEAQEGLGAFGGKGADAAPVVAAGHRQRLKAMGSACNGRLALLMSQAAGVSGVPSIVDVDVMSDLIVRRVAAGRVAATVAALQTKALALRAQGQCVVAAKCLKQAIALGHLPSRADLADMLIDGREGIAQDCARAFELVEEGAGWGCHHCQGVLSRCYSMAAAAKHTTSSSWPRECHVHANDQHVLQLAQGSAAKGSRYKKTSARPPTQIVTFFLC